MVSLDLNTGHVIDQVHDRHQSKEFIELLKELDGYYPKEYTIRIILDNHSAHISKETMQYYQVDLIDFFMFIHKSTVHGLIL